MMANESSVIQKRVAATKRKEQTINPSMLLNRTLLILVATLTATSAQRGGVAPPYEKDDFVSCPTVLGLFAFTDA